MLSKRLQKTDRTVFNPFDHKGWLRYFGGLLPRFQYIRNLGLPHLKDRPDLPIEQMYVPVYLGERYFNVRDHGAKDKSLKS